MSILRVSNLALNKRTQMCGVAALTKKRQSTMSTYYVFVATCCFLFGFCGNLHTWTDSLLSVEIVHFLLLVFYKYSSNYAQKGSQHLPRLNLSPSRSSRKLNSPAFFQSMGAPKPQLRRKFPSTNPPHCCCYCFFSFSGTLCFGRAFGH